jgi:hypothetical protein
MDNSGDFPFFVDALTIAGFPSLFSGFRLHRESKSHPLEARPNPAPLLRDKYSLFSLCNFDFERHLQENPGVDMWLVGTSPDMVWKMTSLLFDFIIVYTASVLARYYVPAWREIVDATKTDLYNDIRASYRGVAELTAYYFSDEHPFQYSFNTRVGP